MKTTAKIFDIVIESKLESKRDYSWDYLGSVKFHSSPKAKRVNRK